MSEMQNENQILELRKTYPTLTHTSDQPLQVIHPRPNVDKHFNPLGNVVFATNDAADFYALRSNDGYNLINYSIPSEQGNLFVFEKMREESYEHILSSQDFIPVVSNTGRFSGEWISKKSVSPQKVVYHKKEDILKRTKAYVFTITDISRFREIRKTDSFMFRLRNPKTAFQALQELVEQGILKRENNPRQNKINLSLRNTERE